MKTTRLAVVLAVGLSLLSSCKKSGEPIYYESGRKGTAEAPVKEVPKDILATQQAFTTLAQKVTPCVVNISTVSRKRIVQPFFELSPFFDDFLGGRNARPQYKRENSLGSGIIINRAGYIITNDHVVKDAESIQVKLSNENVYDAKVVGSDPKTDIAVIKINAREELPVAVLGDSSKLKVGQWAIAIGNPFGLDRTVTVGVVSATGRSNMGIETYEDFIQTDASINPGNSGGPLLNVYGEVIGINTAIVAAGQGIGFAIPVNLAKQVVEQLVKKGSVTRGWLGVSIQPVTDDLAKSFGLNRAAGALVSDVLANSPAAKAGLKQGDIIIRYDGTSVQGVQQLQLLAAETPVGKSVKVGIFRGGRELDLTLTVANADSAEARQARTERAATSSLGITVEELPAELRRSGLSGVIVTDVQEDGAAANAGILPDDIIVSANQQKITSVADFNRLMKEATRRGTVALLVRRGNANIYFAVNLR